LEGRVRRALEYLLGRDVDGDHLLEQGPNQDWADILLRHGKVSYTQAVWYRCLGCAAAIFEALGDDRTAQFCRERASAVRGAINEHLLTPHGFYANYRHINGFSLRRALDTSLLIAFGVEPGEDVARSVLECLDKLEGPFGPAVMEPGYTPADIGPAKYPPSQYQNEGIWPWITSYLVLAWARVGNEGRARHIVSSLISANPGTIHEWIDNLTGEAHHPDFATAAGALAWALTEGALATWDGRAVNPDGAGSTRAY
jgi:glycogen debranching enzyme